MLHRSTTCERIVAWRPRLDGWGSVAIRCNQSVGLVSWTDDSGIVRYACHNHRDALMSRYPIPSTETEDRMAWGDR